jgi:hypothetical protein
MPKTKYQYQQMPFTVNEQEYVVLRLSKALDFEQTKTLAESRGSVLIGIMDVRQISDALQSNRLNIQMHHGNWGFIQDPTPGSNDVFAARFNYEKPHEESKPHLTWGICRSSERTNLVILKRPKTEAIPSTSTSALARV